MNIAKSNQQNSNSRSPQGVITYTRPSRSNNQSNQANISGEDASNSTNNCTFSINTTSLPTAASTSNTKSGGNGEGIRDNNSYSVNTNTTTLYNNSSGSRNSADVSSSISHSENFSLLDTPVNSPVPTLFPTYPSFSLNRSVSPAPFGKFIFFLYAPIY